LQGKNAEEDLKSLSLNSHALCTIVQGSPRLFAVFVLVHSGGPADIEAQAICQSHSLETSFICLKIITGISNDNPFLVDENTLSTTGFCVVLVFKSNSSHQLGFNIFINLKVSHQLIAN